MKPEQTELVAPAEKSRAVAVIQSEPPAPIAVNEPLGGPMDIMRYALDKGAGVDVIERMMVVRRELRAEKAKEAFDQAMRDLQAEMPIIAKGKAVPDASGKVAYSYAPLEDILAQVRPLLQKHGFSYTLDTDTESKDGWVIAKCTVTHCLGHSSTSTAKFPLGAGTRIMSTTQVYASALTFASRRVFCNSFGIVTGGEDQDGRTERTPEKPASKFQPTKAEPTLKTLAQELWNVLKPVRGTAKDWTVANSWLRMEDLLGETETPPDLTAERFREITEKARKILEQERAT